MEYLNKIKKIIKENSLDKIWIPGVVEMDTEIADVIKDTNYLYLELGDWFIKLEAIESYGKIEVTISKEFIYEVDLDEKLIKVDVSDIVFTNPLATNRINNIGFTNIDIHEDKIICDVLHLKLEQQDDIFIDPSFCGINIGNIKQKTFWLDNLLYINKKPLEIKELWI